MPMNIGIAYENWKNENSFLYTQMCEAGFNQITIFTIFESIYLSKDI